MEPIKTMKMGVHVGNALGYVTNNYPTLTKVVLELVQNSLDSDADVISVVVDYKTQMLCVRDNGCGISPDKFQLAISSVCSSLKQTSGKLGQFGIGMLSPLGKCRGFVVTSAAKSDKHEYNRWIFDSEAILKGSSLPEIPMVPMASIAYSRSRKSGNSKVEAVDWRTEVALDHFSNDKSISSISLSELKSLILGQFSEAMRRLNCQVNIAIKRLNSAKKELDSFQAASFSGEPFGQVEYGDMKSGRTMFDMYLAPKTKTGRKGQILVGIEGNDFRIPLAVFAKSTPEMGNDVAQTLLSGTLEGAVISSNCSLNPNRKEFEDNEARLNFLIHLESWVKNHGQKHIASIKDGERDVWLQAVGSMAISQLEERIKSQLPHLLGVVKSFKMGTIGPGHIGFEEAKQEQPFLSSKKGLSERKKKRSRPTIDTSSVDREPTLHPGHTPFTVAGEGAKRRLVRGHSTGLQFVFEEMPGNDNHWEFEPKNGTLTFNMRSDIWAKMETSERNLILYQQYVAIKALEMQLEAPAVRQPVFEFLQRELKSAAIFITSTSTLQPRKSRSEIGKKAK
jgi:hypothetical protein